MLWLLSAAFFSKLTFSKKSQMVWIQIRTDRMILSVLISVQTVCKCYQQNTKVAASKERVNIGAKT